MKIYAKWIPNEGQRQAMNKLPYAGDVRSQGEVKAAV